MCVCVWYKWNTDQFTYVTNIILIIHRRIFFYENFQVCYPRVGYLGCIRLTNVPNVQSGVVYREMVQIPRKKASMSGWNPRLLTADRKRKKAIFALFILSPWYVLILPPRDSSGKFIQQASIDNPNKVIIFFDYLKRTLIPKFVRVRCF